MGGTECGSERAVIGIERGRCVRRSDRVVKVIAIGSICLDQDAVGTRLSSVIPKHSTSVDVEECRTGTSEMFRTYASSRVLSTAIQTSTIAYLPLKRSAGGVNARSRAGRAVGAPAESVDAAEHRMKIPQRAG